MITAPVMKKLIQLSEVQEELNNSFSISECLSQRDVDVTKQCITRQI